jgi:hypothetical protein
VAIDRLQIDKNEKIPFLESGMPQWTFPKMERTWQMFENDSYRRKTAILAFCEEIRGT